MKAAEIFGMATGVIFAVFIVAALVGLIGGTIVWLLWPFSGMALGLPALSYWQAVSLTVVCTILSKGSGTVGHGCWLR